VKSPKGLKEELIKKLSTIQKRLMIADVCSVIGYGKEILDLQDSLRDIDRFVEEEIKTNANISLRINDKVFDKMFMKNPPPIIKYPLVIGKDVAFWVKEPPVLDIIKRSKILLFKKNCLESYDKENNLVYGLWDMVVE